MTKRLVPLDEYNAQRWAVHDALTKPCGNGIACPECGAELLDSSPNVVLTSNPPQKHVHCSQCTYRGYRLA